MSTARTNRIAAILRDVVEELLPGGGPLTLIARGIALQAQAARLSPAAFDCPNGRDALAAVALAIPRRELMQIARSNAFVLEARWGRVLLAADLDGDHRDIPDRMSTWPPKLFDGWVPK